MADPVRTITVWQPQDVTARLIESGWNFHIAHSMIKAGSPVCNIVWQSKEIAPFTKIEWRSKDKLGLNWTANVPSAGAKVTIGGQWHQCNPGQVLDLNKNGYFEPSKEPPHPGSLKVGKVHYKHRDVHGIHIVVGLRNEVGDYEPIFVDPAALPPNSTAQYTPHNQVKWWYETEFRTATIISNDVTEVQELDFSKPNSRGKYYYSTTFNDDEGTWSISPDEPEQ